MLLGCRILKDVQSVNSFRYANTLEMFAGDATQLYVQLIDMSLDKTVEGFNPSGRRYMPASTSTMQVTLGNIDDAKKVVKTASQPFTQDPSIWLVNILTTDALNGTIPIVLKLVEPTRTLMGRVNNAISVSSVGDTGPFQPIES